jgi:hypothetical protein
MAKNNKPAEVYAAPHTMDGKAVSAEGTSIHGEYNPDQLSISVGNISAKTSNPQINKNGETLIRGCGAATKGTKARGPMA